MKQVEFFQYLNQQASSCPSPQCLVDQIHVQVRPYGRFAEIESSPGKKKFHRMDKGSNFIGGSFSNRENVRVSIHF